MKRLAVLAVLATLLVTGAAPASATTADPPGAQAVVTWNRALLGLLRTPGVQPATVHPTRSMAMMHLAMLDAAGVHRSHRHVHGTRRAAVAVAAHDVLVALYPAQSATLDALLDQELAAVTDPRARLKGRPAGALAAAKVLAARRGDGSDATPPPYVTTGAPGDFQPVAAAAFTHWAAVRPFVLRRADEFRPAAPPALGSDAYAAALNEVQALGRSDSTVRSAEQTTIARFWSAAIQNYWNEIAQAVVLDERMGVRRAARVFAVMDVAFADSAIAFYDAKYHYRLWRPITAIRAADTDGNPATVADATWAPLLNTPADPSYPGAHSVVAAAGAAVLAALTGSDRHALTVSSESLPGVQRTFTSFSAARDEAGLSRLYAGVHYRFDDTAGQRLGEQVARVALRRIGGAG